MPQNRRAIRIADEGERQALRLLAKRGRAGARAREIGNTEADGLRIGAALVRRGWATVTRGNQFILVKYLGKVVPGDIVWDDDERAGRIDR